MPVRVLFKPCRERVQELARAETADASQNLLADLYSMPQDCLPEVRTAVDEDGCTTTLKQQAWCTSPLS
jgi:hypothetical protein